MSQYIFTIILVSIGLGMCPFRNAIAQISEQPLLKAPWRGVAQISQGNRANKYYLGTSHYRHETWENTYAIDVCLPVGTDVLAPADGVVKWFDPDSGGQGGKELYHQNMFDAMALGIMAMTNNLQKWRPRTTFGVDKTALHCV